MGSWQERELLAKSAPLRGGGAKAGSAIDAGWGVQGGDNKAVERAEPSFEDQTRALEEQFKQKEQEELEALRSQMQAQTDKLLAEEAERLQDKLRCVVVVYQQLVSCLSIHVYIGSLLPRDKVKKRPTNKQMRPI